MDYDGKSGYLLRIPHAWLKYDLLFQGVAISTSETFNSETRWLMESIDALM